MTVIVKTARSTYQLHQDGQEWILLLPMLREGRVISMKKVEEGRPLEVSYIAKNIYLQEESDVSWLRTSPVKEITVILGN